MIWMTWRQHRAEAGAALLLLAMVVAILLLTGLPLHHNYVVDGAQGCVAQAPGSRAGNCDELIGQFSDQYQNVVNLIVPWMTLLPALAGIFIGAPLLAREFEQGTWQLAWTQAVPRMRWLSVKLAALVGGVVVFGAAVTLIYTWWHAPVDQVQGRLTSDAFNMEGLVFTAYSLFALALGTLAGTLIRRLIPAMAVAFGGFLLVRLPLESWVRPHYLPPLTLTFDPITNPNVRIGGVGGQWILAKGYALANGHHLSTAGMAAAVQAAARAHTDILTYLHLHHMVRWYSYQPASRFWPFQFIEAGIFVALAAVLLGLVTWRVNREMA
jgi:hypothetical protein